VAVDQFTGKGGRFVRGGGRLVGPGTVEVDGERYQARRAVVLATGTKPVIPPIAGLADTPYWTNREAIEAKTLPASLLVLGGGAVGLELAQVFARFGVAVTVVEALVRLLPVEEPESSMLAQSALEADGITVRTGTRATAVAYDGHLFTVTVDDDDFRAELLLVAVGRRAELGPLGVDSVGIEPGAPAVPVDGWMRAGERLWAVGDITGHGAFTHMAMYQAGIAVRDILGKNGPPADYRAVPRVTFTDPEIASVGLTEAQARDAGLRIAVGLTNVPWSARGWIHKAGNDGFIKVIADAERSMLVGCHFGRTHRRRGAVRARRGGSRSGHRRHPATHDLRLPDIPPRHRRHPAPARLEPVVARIHRNGGQLPRRSDELFDGAGVGLYRGRQHGDRRRSCHAEEDQLRLKERAVLLVREHRAEYSSTTAAAEAVARRSRSRPECGPRWWPEVADRYEQ
jgi:thioredoxin reductase